VRRRGGVIMMKCRHAQQSYTHRNLDIWNSLFHFYKKKWVELRGGEKLETRVVVVADACRRSFDAKPKKSSLISTICHGQ
jgi:hypothetical protein